MVIVFVNTIIIIIMVLERMLQTKGRDDGIAKDLFFLMKMIFFGNRNIN